MAEAFPSRRFVGVDYHEESIQRATAAAEAAGVAAGCTSTSVTRRRTPGSYDLVCFFDAVHDMGDPVGALRARPRAPAPRAARCSRSSRSPRTRSRTTSPNPAALAYYVGQLAAVRAEQHLPGRAALGAQAGPARITAAFLAAGFTTARVAAETPYNLLIEARG